MPRMEGTTLHAIIAPSKKAEQQAAAKKPAPRDGEGSDAAGVTSRTDSGPKKPAPVAAKAAEPPAEPEAAQA